MVMALRCGLMVLNMKGNGYMIRWKDKVKLNILMITSMKENSFRIKLMAKAGLSIKHWE